MEIIPSLQHHPQTFSKHPKPTEQIVRQIRNFIQDPLGNDSRSTSEIQEDFFNLPYVLGESTGTQHQTAPKSSDDMAISNHAPRHFPTPYVALYSAHCHLEKISPRFSANEKSLSPRLSIQQRFSTSSVTVARRF